MNAEPEPAALRRARLVVAYDGAGFHGFAESAATPTVMGVLRAAIETFGRGLDEPALRRHPS